MVESTAMEGRVALPKLTSSEGEVGDGIGRENGGDWRKTVALKASTEFDSETSVFVNKVSARVFDGLAKLKASFQRGTKDEVRAPLFGLVTKYVSVLYDHEDRNAMVTVNTNWRNVGVRYKRDIKEEQGELGLTATGFNHKLRAEVEVDLPRMGSLPRGKVMFPFGEVKVDEEIREDEEGEQYRVMTGSGFVAGSGLGGLIIGSYKDENVQLKYAYKDEEVTVRPSIEYPSLIPELSLKRQFNKSNKLSYLYNFSTTEWSAVYKNKPNDNFKLKLGYDSNYRLFWGSTWVGKEESGAKQAPRKCKLQVMLQVPQDDIKSSTILFRVKKRWDL